jgi:uncharacterized tellurite resistance protein B-like protein
MKNLTDLIYAKTGIAFDLPGLASNLDAQSMVATLIALVAKSDGGVSPDETARMVEMMRGRFQLRPNEALSLITRAVDELAPDTHLDEILSEINNELPLAHKEDVMLMVLHIISADNVKDAQEMKLLSALMDGLKIPWKVMDNVYARYFEEKKAQN